MEDKQDHVHWGHAEGGVNLSERAANVEVMILAAPRKRGSAGDKRALLDEVARIEAEWGVV